MIPPIRPKKTRVIKLAECHNIIYIKHLGSEPYNEVKFVCGKTIIVSYSLNYWQTVFKDFQRINRSVLINPHKIISEVGILEIELADQSRFTFSRRKFKNALNEKSVIND